MTIKRQWSALLIVITLLSGCAALSKPHVIVEGTDHYVRIPKGTHIPVTMDFEGTPKQYDYVTKNDGAFYDVTSEADALQARPK